jgi:hypothetical protein
LCGYVAGFRFRPAAQRAKFMTVESPSQQQGGDQGGNSCCERQKSD